MAFMKKVGTAVLGLAILVGGIGKFAPYWFLSLPFPLSIILWDSTGNPMPPCEYEWQLVFALSAVGMSAGLAVGLIHH